jgi:hypothetical protein
MNDFVFANQALVKDGVCSKTSKFGSVFLRKRVVTNFQMKIEAVGFTINSITYLTLIRTTTRPI